MSRATSSVAPAATVMPAPTVIPAKAGIQFVLLAALTLGLSACGQDTPPPDTTKSRTVTGAAMKGPLQGATVSFFLLDAAGNATGSALATAPAIITTDATGGFTVGGIPADTLVLVKTSGGEYFDESDPATGAARRRITLASTEKFEAVIPANASTVAITPYSMAMLKKARLQAGGGNFANVFEAVRTQATTAFGFDPFTTIPTDPMNPAAGASAEAIEYALLLGAAAQSINAIATSAGHLPVYADVMLFVEDLGTDGDFDLVDFEAELARFRNNNFGAYGGGSLPVVDFTLLSGDAPVANSAPVAVDDAILVAEGDTATMLDDGLTASVLDNDSDPDGDPLTATTATGPASGALTLNSDGTFSYVHDGSETASDSFTYVANDGTDDSNTATVTVTVSAVNDAPVLDVNAGLTINEGDVASLSIVDLSASDVDNADTELTFIVSAGPAGGSLLLDGVTPITSFTQDQLVAGRVSYTHAGGEVLSDSFDFTVQDAGTPALSTAAATFDIIVLPVNDAPLAVNDGPIAALQDATLTASAPGVLANDTDAEGSTLSAVLVSTTTSGTLSLGSTGGFSYSPNAGFVGTDTFTYRASDGTAESADATVTIEIKPHVADAQLISVNSAGSDSGNAQSFAPVVSGDGRYAAFVSDAADLVTTPTVSTFRHVYRRDLGTGMTELVSQFDGIEADGNSFDACISHDGNLVGFITDALGLVGGSTPPGPQFVVRDMTTGDSKLVSMIPIDVGEGRFQSVSAQCAFSEDGRYFVFLGIGPAAASETSQHVWGFDLQGSTSQQLSASGAIKISLASDGETEVCGVCQGVDISSDGRWIVFASTISPDNDGFYNILLKDMDTGELINLTPANGPGDSHRPTISSDGKRIAFEADDGSGATDFFVHDRLASATARVNTRKDGSPGTGPGLVTPPVATRDGFGDPVISKDGRYVTFTSTQNGLAGVDSALESVFVKKLPTIISAGDATGPLARLNLNTSEVPYDAEVFGAGIGFQGQRIVFFSAATNIVSPDSNGAFDAFWFDNPLFFDELLDTDGDGLKDSVEMGTYGSLPGLSESDGDGLADGDEVNSHGTDPADADTDGDGANDGLEVGYGSSPTVANTVIHVCTGGCGNDANGGTSWTDAVETNTAAVGKIPVGGGASGAPVYVLYNLGFPGPGSLALTGSDRHFVNFIGGINPETGLETGSYTEFDGNGSTSAATISQATAIKLRNLRLQNGNQSAAIGGGLLVTSPVHSTDATVSAFLENVEISGNTAFAGGGFAISGTGFTVDMQNVLVTQNSSINNISSNGIASGGGGIVGSGAILNLSSSEIQGNSSSCTGTCIGHARGAGLTVQGSANLYETKVRGNTTDSVSGVAYGGGIYVEAGGALDIASSTVSGNKAYGSASAVAAHGGGIYVAGDLSADHIVVADNTAAGIDGNIGFGGGIHASSSEGMLLQHSMILSNKADLQGGGVYASSPAGTGFAMFNNLVVGNLAAEGNSGAGGGIYTTGTFPATPTPSNMHSNTVAYNQAMPTATGRGGGGYFGHGGNIDFVNNIFWFNDNGTSGAHEAGDDLAGSGGLSHANNNLGDNALTPPEGTDVNADPLFVEGFYLNQVTPSPSVDSGHSLAPTAPFTTDPAGGNDGTPDMGFHHSGGSSGTADATTEVQIEQVFCSSVSVSVVPEFGFSTEPGHLVVAKVINGSSTPSSLTSLTPEGAGSVLAVDDGDGTYSFILSTGGLVDLEIYVDGVLVTTVTGLDTGFAC